MRAVLQRVSSACVTVDEEKVSSIKSGILLLLGIAQEDNEEVARLLAEKTAKLRIFEDEDEKMNLSLKDIDGEILVVSNFTLYASCKKGCRPSFTAAAGSKFANEMYEYFCESLKNTGIKAVKKGVFAADMKVELINDGPVTIILDSNEL